MHRTAGKVNVCTKGARVTVSDVSISTAQMLKLKKSGHKNPRTAIVCVLTIFRFSDKMHAHTENCQEEKFGFFSHTLLKIPAPAAERTAELGGNLSNSNSEQHSHFVQRASLKQLMTHVIQGFKN